MANATCTSVAPHLLSPSCPEPPHATCMNTAHMLLFLVPRYPQLFLPILSSHMQEEGCAVAAAKAASAHALLTRRGPVAAPGAPPPRTSTARRGDQQPQPNEPHLTASLSLPHLSSAGSPTAAAGQAGHDALGRDSVKCSSQLVQDRALLCWPSLSEVRTKPVHICHVTHSTCCPV